MALDYRCGFLNQILELRVLGLTCSFGRQIENRFVSLDLSIDVGLVEILALGGGVESVRLVLSHWHYGIVRWSGRGDVQLLGQRSTLCAKSVMIAHHVSPK